MAIRAPDGANKRHLNNIGPFFAVVIIVGPIIQVQVSLLLILASDAALDFEMAVVADHDDEANKCHSTDKAEHSNENIPTDCFKTCEFDS